MEEWGHIKQECYNEGYSQASSLLHQYYSGPEDVEVDKTLLQSCFWHAGETMDSNIELQDKLSVTKTHLQSGQEILAALNHKEGSFSFSEYQKLQLVLDGFITEIESCSEQIQESPRFTFYGNIVNTQHTDYISEGTNTKIEKIGESIDI